MATLTWIRDHYDTKIRDRYIDSDEASEALNDYLFEETITKEDYEGVYYAYEHHTLLPPYDGGEHMVTIEMPATAMLTVDGVDIL